MAFFTESVKVFTVGVKTFIESVKSRGQEQNVEEDWNKRHVVEGLNPLSISPRPEKVTGQ